MKIITLNGFAVLCFAKYFICRLRNTPDFSKMIPVKTVLFIKSSNMSSLRQRVAGFMDYAAKTDWNVQIVEPVKNLRELERLVKFWNPAGCAVCCGAGNNDFPSMKFHAPVVYIDRPLCELSHGDSSVCHDSAATAKMAARELLSLNLASYAYVGLREPMDWDWTRRETFAEVLKPLGKSLAIFDSDACTDDSRSFLSHLAEWLKTLPKPLGVFGATDIVAAKVISACHRAGLTVPDDCSVIGIDNDADICEYVKPTLTSVEPDYRAAGRAAAEALDQLMEHVKGRWIRVSYAPLRLIRRQSTRRLTRCDGEVSAALERIRKDACNGLTAHEVLAGFSCSRRMAELRFRKAAGRSVLEEIRSVRLNRAGELLRDPDLKLDAIANWCGYKSAAAFAIFYKAETGKTPRQRAGGYWFMS